MSAPSPRRPSTTARDPVRLLEPQLGGAAHHGLAVGERAEQRHQRQLVDGQRHLVRAHLGALERPPRPRRARRRGSVSVSVPGSSSSHTTTAPMRSAIRKKAVRVQLRPMPETTTREPGTSMAAATTKAADEGSPGHHHLVELDLVHLRRRSAGRPRASNGTRARRSMRSVWSRLGAGSTTVVEPSASIPAISTQDLTWALATGSAYSMPAELGPADGEGRKAPVAGLHARAHRGQRLRHAVHGPAPDRLVAVERPGAARLPGEPAGQQPHQGARVAARRAGRRWPRAARAGPRRGPAPSRRRPPPPRRRGCWSAPSVDSVSADSR